MAEQGVTGALLTLARAYARGGDPARRAAAPVRLDEQFCRQVADVYDRAPLVTDPGGMAGRYAELADENLRQFELVRRAGIRVRPWTRAGQPYRDSRHLITEVRRTGELFVFLTRSGHGPGDGDGGTPHPLRAPSGIVAGGERLAHNDIFRAVHDVFGHVLFGNDFGPRGEFRAAWCHLTMYPPRLHPLLFAELVAQICWFYRGPHLRDARGVLRRPGDPGYLPPAQRPYPPQKQLVYDEATLRRFAELCGLTPAGRD